jgi:uncharacterized protein YdaU (DUF1376 family)
MLMQVRGMGDNSAAFGEELRAEIETVLGDDHEAVFHYAQWHIGDYIAGTEGMVLETEGAYIRFLMRLYRRGKPLPDNDSFMATAMGLTTRVWRRVRQVLIEFGKIIVRNGCLTNSRFERERQRRAEEMRKRAESARLRWEKDRSQKAGLPEVSAKFAGSLAEVSSKLPANDAKKANKDIPASTSQEAARGMLDEIDGLNGATVLMQNKIAKWMHPVMPRYSEARTWLTNVVQLFGSDIVRDAFAAVEAKQASGDIVPSPIKLMSAICQQKVKAAKADEGKPKPKTFIDSIVLPDKKPRPREEAI